MDCQHSPVSQGRCIMEDGAGEVFVDSWVQCVWKASLLLLYSLVGLGMKQCHPAR